MRRRWATGLWVAAILCVLFYGCVRHTTEHIIITYHAQEDVNRIEEAGNVAIKIKVTDLRTEANYKGAGKEKETGIVGGVYNDWGRLSDAVIAKNDLSELIAHAIETELTHRGFKSGENVLIEVDLIKFYSYFAMYTRNTADLIFHVDVKKPDGTLVYSNLVRGKWINPNAPPWFPIFPKVNIVVLEATLKDGVSKLVNDPEFIKSLIKANAN